jgi:hypothetical protein
MHSAVLLDHCCKIYTKISKAHVKVLIKQLVAWPANKLSSQWVWQVVHLEHQEHLVWAHLEHQTWAAILTKATSLQPLMPQPAVRKI